MNTIYFRPIVNKKESKKRKRLNKLKCAKKMFKHITSYPDTSKFTGEIGIFMGVSWVTSVGRPKLKQKRGRAYWSKR